MDKKIAFIFPGQGAQYVGMGKSFYQQFKIARQTFEQADDLLHFNLSKLCFEGPRKELALTQYSQLAIYVMCMALFRSLCSLFPSCAPVFAAGLSLGEYTALTVSGRLSFEETLFLVQARALAMHEASQSRPGAMAVCLGLSPERVKDLLSSAEDVFIANLNCPGQVALSGTRSGLDRVTPLLKRGGAKRILPLDVSGAFHSPLMEEARLKLKERIDLLPLNPSDVDLVMNARGESTTEEEIPSALIEQMTSPVLWEKGVRYMDERGVDLFVEIGCGKSLSGMNRKIGVKGATLSIEKVEEMDGALRQLREGAEYGTT